MKYWWVNHKQTGKIEVEEGYIWAPKANSNGSRNQTYINLTDTRTGDIIFSYAFGEIRAVGVILEPARDNARPSEFGATGQQWAEHGWLVTVNWVSLRIPFSPKARIDLIAPLLPTKYSPLQMNGNGNQGCYLAEIDQILSDLLFSFINEQNPLTSDILLEIRDDLKADLEVEKEINEDGISPTKRTQLIEARKGQGIFRMNVEAIERHCRITGLSEKALLIASHIKPWRDSSDFERLDGNNGLLLSPHIDKLFDRGFISFRNEGRILISERCPSEVFTMWRLDRGQLVGDFNNRQKEYLEYHRDIIFR